jgi:aspartyl-tRNA(Asn)/glutamyl-tRNA(Gln) amidotransferase subunit B
MAAITVDGYQVQPIIGMEIHVHLRTRTKMWCGCAVEYGQPPNTRVCPVCLGLPGALPVPNRKAVELTIRTGVALNCAIPEFTKWDRKSYYYPDLPKNYQISQYDLPLCGAGYLEFPFEHEIRKIAIRRAHLEEDAGKNVHDFPGCTGVDLNRAGTPLLEIVTEPDLRSAAECREFAVQLRRIVRYLGVSAADMQNGQMRFEPNINLQIETDGKTYTTPIVEVKNLNSFRSLYGAVEFETRRQVRQWRETGVTAETGNKSNRGWDDVREVTVAQREKEEAADYRYFPDPDLAPVKPDPAWVARLRDTTPELPIPRTERFISEYKLPPKDAPSLVDCRASADLLDHAAECPSDKPALGRHFMSFWAKLAKERKTTIAGLAIPASRIAELTMWVADGTINATAAAQIAEEMVRRVDKRLDQRGFRPTPDDCGVVYEPVDGPEIDPARLADELGLRQSSDSGKIAEWIDAAFAQNDKAVSDARGNPKKMQAARGFLTGQVMKLSGGRADPKVAGQMIAKKLSE